MKITLNKINEDYLFESKNKTSHSILMDNTSKTESIVKGVSPMECVLMALAGCNAVGIVRILKKQRIKSFELNIEIEATKKMEGTFEIFDTIDAKISIDGKITKSQAERAVNNSFDKYCSVSKILEATATINHKIILNNIPL